MCMVSLSHWGVFMYVLDGWDYQEALGIRDEVY